MAGLSWYMTETQILFCKTWAVEKKQQKMIKKIRYWQNYYKNGLEVIGFMDRCYPSGQKLLPSMLLSLCNSLLLDMRIIFTSMYTHTRLITIEYDVPLCFYFL